MNCKLEWYLTLAGTTPTYYYYLKDHQGNNRVVINHSGAVQQVNHYYPFGGLFGEGIQTSNQPYKYNGKELDRFQGVDMYDYGARHYDAALGRWFNVDPMAEKYYFESPYVYVHNSSMIHIDPDGKDGLIVISGNRITICSNIILTGSKATTDLANIYKRDIMDNWGMMKSYTHNGTKYDITWDVNVKVAQSGEKKDFNGVNNYLEVKGNENSKVFNTHYGMIRSTHLDTANPMSHEFGHILGLRDKYGTDENDPITFRKSISKYWIGNVMAEAAGEGIIDERNMEILLEKPLEWHKLRQSLFPDKKEEKSIFEPDLFDSFKDSYYWINYKYREH